MGLETVTHIADLNELWPLGSDLKAEGDNHIRNIKKALKTDFPDVAALATKTAQPYNRVVNGAMQHSQENGNTAGTALGYFAADQWMLTYTTTGTVSAQRVQKVTPNGSQDRIRYTQTVADTSIAATENVQIVQRIEGLRVADLQWGTAQAKQIVVRFGFSGPAGTYGLSIRNSADNRCYVQNFTISAGQANTDTVQTFAVPGDTTGTWLKDTGIGIQFSVNPMSGSTYTTAIPGWNAGIFLGATGLSNWMAVTGQPFELFDVGLYADPNATGVAPPWQTPDYASELAACKRYWEYIPAQGLDAYVPGSGSVPTYRGLFSVAKRTTPSMSSVNANNANCGTVTTIDLIYVTGWRAYRASTAAGMMGFTEQVIANARM
jgi:hypothetical protein